MEPRSNIHLRQSLNDEAGNFGATNANSLTSKFDLNWVTHRRNFDDGDLRPQRQTKFFQPGNCRTPAFNLEHAYAVSAPKVKETHRHLYPQL